MKNKTGNGYLRKILTAVLLLGMITMLWGGSVAYAVDVTPRVMMARTIDDSVRAFVRGGNTADGATYQIGNVPAEVSPKGHALSEDALPMRTLIMLDNSFSIPKADRGMIKEAIKGIIAGHAENEQFRLATFAEEITYLSDRYSDDYTALGNMVDLIQHADQNTMLTDVLYQVLEELNTEGYEGYTRIIVIADGVNNKPTGGRTLDQVKALLQDNTYPIYTIGCSTGKNDELLDNLFSLSWTTGSEYVVLNKAGVEGITEMTSADNNLVVYEVPIPEDAKTGGKQSSKLTLSDGTELVFDVMMPFSIREKEEPQTIVVEKEVEKVVEVEKPAKKQKEKPEPDGFELPLPLWALVAIGCALVVLIVVIIILLVRKSKKSKAAHEQPAGGVLTAPSSDYEKTVFLSGDSSHSDTVQLTPDGSVAGRKHYRFTLTDSADTARSFRCELVDEISIGRKPDNTIVLSDDIAVHGHHCTVSVKNGTFYITDLKDVKNHSAVNGIALKPGLPQLIVSNSRFTIGRHTYVIQVTEG